MKTTLFLVAAAASLASAQVTYNETTQIFTCDKPNVAYCAGDNLKTNIIIRCDSTGKGQPGNCNDNLAYQPPQGVLPAPCYQSSNTSGDAACSKNCIVYPENGAASYTLPSALCTPTSTTTSKTSSSTKSSSSSKTSSSTLTTATVTSKGVVAGTTLYTTYTTTYCPDTVTTSSTSKASVVSTTKIPVTNGTSATTSKATAVPVGPTTVLSSAVVPGTTTKAGTTTAAGSSAGSSSASTTKTASPTYVTAGAVMNIAGSGLAAVGLALAALL